MGLKEEISKVVEQTTIKVDEKKENGKTYYAYDAIVAADCFEPFSGSLKGLAKASDEYGIQLEKRINEATGNQLGFRNMHAKHIRNETLAHLVIWFYWGKQHKKGLAYRACVELNLNEDENRLPVQIIMWLVDKIKG